MEIYEYLLIIIIGFAAGFLNTVAGGGSLISLPILIFLGLPSVVANATNRVAILFQNIFAVGGFRSKGVDLPMPYSLYLALVSLFGGFIGAKLAINIDDELFNRILAVIMIGVVLSIAFDSRKKNGVQEERMTVKAQVLGIISFFFLGIYGGFIQAGIGFLVIAGLRYINRMSLVKINYIKVFAALIYTGVAVAVFAWEGKIHWFIAMILSIGQALGGWIASRWSVDKGDVWIKRVLVAAVIILAIKLWFF
ncbi:MAG TPA: sulfite exporter TauE/SafE family protein [Cyclobacteriaceae bacterium]|nr:sulfite exporter TauE/SafE family protein [Cyclobacteriaceae bacterium]